MNKISIIIPTLNRQNNLLDTVNYLNLQSFKNFEIIIIDQNEPYNLNFYKYLKTKYKNLQIKILKQEKKNASLARNFGAKYAQNEILLFLDDDVCIKNKLFLKNHIKNYSNSKILIVAGKVIDFPFKNKKNFIFMKNFYFFSLDYSKKIFLYGVGRSCNLSIRKDFFFHLGGMDKNFINGAHKEETDLLFRAKKNGIKVLFDPACHLIHLKAKTGGIRNLNYIKQIFFSMFGDIYFSLKHFSNSNLLLNIIFFLRRFFLNKKSFNILKLFINFLVFTPAMLYSIYVCIMNYKRNEE